MQDPLGTLRKNKSDQSIADVTEFVSKLVTLFPMVKQPPLLLSETEIARLADAEELSALCAVAGADDEILRSSIEAQQTRRGHVATSWKAGETHIWELATRTVRGLRAEAIMLRSS